MIVSRIIQVCWHIHGIDYVMMEVQPYEMKAVLKKHSDMLGIPTMYAIIDGEVEWWPQCKNGEPVVVVAP